MHTGPGDHLPPDYPARTEALNPEQSYIVQAPAGSGKTGLLTQRFLRLLTIVEQPEEIVAITFTRKAAAEMRQRILDALATAENPIPPTDPYQEQSWQLAQAAQTHDQNHDWNLRQHPNRLRILTIDALCAALTRQTPILSGFGGQPLLTEDANAMYRAAAREAMQELDQHGPRGKAVAILLDHRDNRHGELEEMLAQMLAKREQWLRHMIPQQELLPTHDQPLRRSDLEAALRAEIASAMTQATTLIPPTARQHLPEIAAQAAANLEQAGHENLVHWRTSLQWPEAQPDHLHHWLELTRWLLTDKDEWRKEGRVTEGFPPASQARDKREKYLRDTTKAAFKALLADLTTEGESWRQALVHLRRLPPPTYTDAQWKVLAALAGFLPVAAAYLLLTFARQGLVDFAEVAARAVAALGDAEQPSDLALRLDYRLRHLLVDEFQDTSLNQFRLLEGLTAGWQVGDGRTLFLVGDPMQSIYRFREAEVSLFYRARTAGIGQITLIPLTLTANFRSRPTVVHWFNRLFQLVMPEREDPTTGAVPYTEATPFQQSRDLEPVVFLHGRIGRDPEAEAQELAALVQAKRRDHPGESVAILVRSRTHVARIADALHQLGITFQGVELHPLANRPAVRDLMSLIRALRHPADRIAWLAILRAPWCGLSLDDLWRLAAKSPDEPTTLLITKITDPNYLAKLSEDGQERLHRFSSILQRGLDARRRQPWRQLVAWVWLSLGGPATLTDPAAMQDVTSLLDLLETMEAGGEPEDWSAFQQRVDRLFGGADPTGDPLVQVMTIHKAKGLEFDHVLLPGLGHPSPQPPRQILLWLERPLADWRHGLLLAPIRSAAEERNEGIYAFLDGIRREQERHETGRVLYVAVTRARKGLDLLGHLESGRSTALTDQPLRPRAGSPLATLWPGIATEWLAAMAGTAGETSVWTPSPANPATRAIHWQRLASDWQPPPWPAPPLGTAPVTVSDEETGQSFDWAGETIRLAGSVTHRWLRRLAMDGCATWSSERIHQQRDIMQLQLRQLGAPEAILESALILVQQALAATLDDPRGRWILADHQEAAAELALTGRIGDRVRHRVIDRTFVDDQGVRWIIDFKTGRHEGGDRERFLTNEQNRYQGQLEEYAVLMTAVMGRNSQPIRLGLYFPMLAGWREWAFNAGVRGGLSPPAG